MNVITRIAFIAYYNILGDRISGHMTMHDNEPSSRFTLLFGVIENDTNFFIAYIFNLSLITNEQAFACTIQQRENLVQSSTYINCHTTFLPN